ncbi:MAG TPA: PQQ-binding-like beta-propeller repeat protein [Streptosporangiaceae bacterium]
MTRVVGVRAVLAAAMPAGLVLGATGAWAASAGNWSTYLYGSTHSSYNAGERVITPRNVSRLARQWRFLGDRATHPGQPRPGFLASPSVVGSAVYIGSDTGWFYKLSAVTGTVLARRFIGFQPPKTCAPRGFADTATVTVDHSGEPMVYVGGANGVLYALRASDLSVRWRSVIALPSRKVSDYFQWSSPTIARGQVYIGVSSNCDHPLVRGGLVSFSQATGRRLATFYTVGASSRGGSIWSSAAVGPDKDVYVSTGNPARGQVGSGYTDSIVKLSPGTLAPLGAFQIPAAQVTPDSDFGASPTIFGPYVGACNKNGIFYAVSRSTMTLAWSTRIGAAAPRHSISSCSAAAVYDGRSLYLAGPPHQIDGVWHRGSIQRLDPATGRVLWQTGLPNGVIGTPTMDGAGVIAVGTYDFSSQPNAVYLVSAATGQILKRLIKGSEDFAQSVFADGRLFTANGTGLYAWALRRPRLSGVAKPSGAHGFPGQLFVAMTSLGSTTAWVIRACLSTCPGHIRGGN